MLLQFYLLGVLCPFYYLLIFVLSIPKITLLCVCFVTLLNIKTLTITLVLLFTAS